MKRSLSGQSQLRAVAIGGMTGALLTGVIQTGLVQIPAPRPPVARADSQQKIRQELGTFARLAKDLKPSVVNIAVEKVEEQPDFSFFNFPFEFESPQGKRFKPRSRGQGSGVIISSDGFILTNNHVVEGVKTARVTLSDGSELEASVVGTDPKTDLALIRVKSARPLPAAQLGDSDQLEVGDWVMAIGNPFGLEATVTVGVLSGKGRVIGAGPYDNFLQTDASINPGNSGGPLFNTQGQVVGINTAIIPNGQGIGFSIPVNMARDIAQQLKTQGRVVRGFLGVGVQPLSPRLKQALGIPKEVQGALVASLVSSGPAVKAGVKVQDIITSVNGKTVRSDRELLAEIARTPVGQKADLQIWRQGKATSLSVPVVERPDERVSRSAPTSEQPSDQALGLAIQPSERADGVVVVGVARNSPAAEAGIRPGDVIRRVNQREVRDPQDFVSAVRGSGSEALALLIDRNGQTVFVTLES